MKLKIILIILALQISTNLANAQYKGEQQKVNKQLMSYFGFSAPVASVTNMNLYAPGTRDAYFIDGNGVPHQISNFPTYFPTKLKSTPLIITVPTFIYIKYFHIPRYRKLPRMDIELFLKNSYIYGQDFGATGRLINALGLTPDEVKTRALVRNIQFSPIISFERTFKIGPSLRYYYNKIQADSVSPYQSQQTYPLKFSENFMVPGISMAIGSFGSV